MIDQDQGDGRAHDTHDRHVVNGQADVAAVIKRRYRNVPRLPRQERAENLQNEQSVP